MLKKSNMNNTAKSELRKSRRLRQKLSEFAGYTTLHGVNRMASNKRLIGKVLWCAVILVCLGFCTRQIYMLCDQYSRKSVNTIISIQHQTVKFPDISLCNLNPVSLYRLENTTSLSTSIGLLAINIWIRYTLSIRIIKGMFRSEENKTTIGFSRAFKYIATKEQEIRNFMNFNARSEDVIQISQHITDLNPSIDDFIISCIFEGQPCKTSSIVPFFDYYYGQCYRFSTGSNFSKTSGPLFALQLIIDVNQSDYLPSVSKNSGIRLSIHQHGTKPFLQNNGMSFGTGLQTDISLVQKSVERYPSRTRCDENNKFNSIMECFEICRFESVEKKCNCSLGIAKNRTRMCSDDPCVDKVFANLTNSNCNCLSPCMETKYEKTVTTSRWPARNFEPILEELYEVRGLNYSDYRDSLLAVNIDLASLSEEVIKEEPAFTEENLMSNIGGALGLWIGMSIISIGELIELVWLLCSSVINRRRNNTTGPHSANIMDAEPDNPTVAHPDKATVANSDN